ncbi:unnamed protein product [Heterobilharzia americana]|nr:unnamed protein product [Heterobilharzia americana]
MKSCNIEMEAPNIAAIVKARHHARILSPTSVHSLGSTQNHLISSGIYEPSEIGCNMNNFYNVPTTSGQVVCEEVRVPIEDKTHKSRSENAPKLLRGTWSPDDRRLFFQAIRMYGRNFNEITRFIRSRGHCTPVDHQSGLSSSNVESNVNSLHSGSNFVSSHTLIPTLGSNSVGVPCPSSSQSTSVLNTPFSSNSDLNTPCGGRTREQVRFFYQQTWHKIRRYVKFREDVPQHVREVYAIVNYSVLRTRIKKPLDHRLGEKLNELVHCGTTVIKHNGRRFLLRTPVCPALKQLNNISAPTHEFLLPEDVWIELVPRTQTDAWRVVEAEQNPRLRLRVDINRQLSDVILLVENKWQLAAERMRTLLGFSMVQEYAVPSVMLNLCSSQAIDGAIRIQEVAQRMNSKVSLPRTQSNVCQTEKENENQSDTPESSDLITSSASPTLTPSSSYASKFSSNLPITSSTSNAELDLRDLGKQLSIGVTREMAREIKIVTIYLALGCPDRIRFEYQFFCTRDEDGQKQLNPSYSNLLICPPLDPDGDGISNGLRRLLHLNASDYLLHRDWISRHSIQSKPQVPISCHDPQSTTHTNSPTTAPVASTQSNTSIFPPNPNQSTVSNINTPSTGTYLSQISSDSPMIATTQQPALMMYPHPNSIQVFINGQPSVIQLNSSLSSSNPIISSLLATNPPVTSAQSPKLVLLQQPVGQKVQVPIVERPLDHERQVTTTLTTVTQGLYTPMLLKQTTLPVQTSVSSTLTNVTSSPATPSLPTSISSTVENENCPLVTSSIKSLKAFNARRRTSIFSQVNKRLNENSILARELQSKLPTTSTASCSLPSLHSALTHPYTTQSSISPLQTVKMPVGQTSKSFKRDEISVVNDIDSNSSPFLIPPTSKQNSWSSTTMLTNINMDDLLLASTETNQSSSSSSSYSNDTLASLLNTICPPYPSVSSSTTTNLDHPSIPVEISSYPNENTSILRSLVAESSALNLSATITTTTSKERVSFKIEEPCGKSPDFGTTDCVCSYPPVSPSIGDISFTDSMAAAVMDVHHMELGNSDEEQNADADAQYESLIEDEDIKTVKNSNISKSEYNCVTNVEVFLRTNTHNLDKNHLVLFHLYKHQLHH